MSDPRNMISGPESSRRATNGGSAGAGTGQGVSEAQNVPPMCNGICVTAREVGIEQPGVAIPHPDCELHARKATS